MPNINVTFFQRIIQIPVNIYPISHMPVWPHEATDHYDRCIGCRNNGDQILINNTFSTMSKLLHQTCIAGLVKYLSPYTGRISDWMAFALSPFAHCPQRIRHCTLASHLTCPNCYNIMNPHRLCDLPLLLNSLFHDTTLNLARMHFESQHQKSGIYCLLVSVILHLLPTFRRHLKTLFSVSLC